MNIHSVLVCDCLAHTESKPFTEGLQTKKVAGYGAVIENRSINIIKAAHGLKSSILCPHGSLYQSATGLMTRHGKYKLPIEHVWCSLPFKGFSPPSHQRCHAQPGKKMIILRAHGAPGNITGDLYASAFSFFLFLSRNK